jgi:hypothetical protein
MRLVGLLSFYEERPAVLAECVSSLVRAGVGHVVAVDGAYFLYPHGQAWSKIDQHEAITAVCRGADVGLSLHVPPEPWFGNETEKRTVLFRLGELVAGDDGWLWVIDADETVTVGPSRSDLAALNESRFDVAEVRLWQGVESDRVDVAQHPDRRLFRSGLGVTVGPAHDDYRAGGRLLRGQGVQEPAMDLLGVRMEHRPACRSLERTERKQMYYAMRDRLGVEGARA